MQPEGRRRIRGSKDPPNTSGPGSLNVQAASPSPPFWSEWTFDDDHQLLHRTLIDYNGRILREQFGRRPPVRQEGGTGLERIRDDGQTAAGATPPSYGSAVGQGQPRPWTEPERLNPYIERPGPYQPAPLQPSPRQSYPPPMQQAYELSRSMSLTYDPATEFQPGSYISSTQRPQASFVSENSSYGPSLGPQQRQNLVNIYANSRTGSSTSLQDSPYGPPIPSVQSQRYDNPVERSQLSSERSAHDEEFSGAQDGAGYMTIRNPGGYFRPGRIFKTRAKLAETEKAYQGEQTFVVLQDGQGAAVCAPLQTYDMNSSGYAYGGENRASVFATGDAPELLPGEDPPRRGQFPVFVEEPSDRIDPKSRIDFSSPFKIEHNTKVRNVGRVDRNSVRELKSTFQETTDANMFASAELVDFKYAESAPDVSRTWSENTMTNDIETSQLIRSSRRGHKELEHSPNRHSIAAAKGSRARSRQWSAYETEESPRNEQKRSSPKDRGAPPGESFAQPLPRDKSSRPPAFYNPSISGDSLHSDYQVRQSKDFRKGRVFKVLWSEPAGRPNIEDSETEETEEIEMPTKFGEKVYSSIRRFVVVKERNGHCLCVPILTYGRQGTNKPGIKSRNHAVIHTGEKAPDLLPGEDGINHRPVRVHSFKGEKLAPESRVNYSKLYTIEQNLKVCFIGRIHPDSAATFFTDFEYTFSS